jgi:HK97 family phage portal protein
MNIFKRINNYLKKSFSEESSGLSGLFETNYRSVRSLDKKSPLDINEISLYLNKAIEKRAREVSKVKFKILNKEGEEVNSKRAENILNVLKKPNKVMAGTEFWRLYQIYKDLEGEDFIRMFFRGEIFNKEGNIEELHLLIPGRVKTIRDDEGGVELYEYHTGNKTLKIPSDEVVRTYTPDPKNQLNPVSLIKAGIRTIETEVQLREYQNKILSNGGKIEGIFKFDTKNGLTEKQIKEMKRRYEEHFAGAENAGKPLFLGGDANYEKIGLSPTELSYLESLGATLDDICVLTEVPKSVLSNLTDIKYSNAEESQKIFMKFTVKPLLDDLVNNLNEFLVPDDLVLSYEDIIWEDQEEKRQNLKIADGVSALTTNEKRERLGLEPVNGGDEILVPINKVPLSFSGEKEEKKKSFSHPFQSYEKRRLYEKIAIRKMDRKEEVLEDEIIKYFRRQKERVVDSLEEIKSFKKGIESEIFDVDKETKVGISIFEPILREFFQEEGQSAVERMGGEQFVLDSDAESWVNERTRTFTKEINETTYKDITKEVAESVELGETRNELVERIGDKYDNFEKSRTKTIARTEVHSVINHADLKGYKQTNTPIKIWVAVMDEVTRPSHQMLDGEEKPIDMPFSNGLMYPGDPKGVASEIINCRCVI